MKQESSQFAIKNMKSNLIICSFILFISVHLQGQSLGIAFQKAKEIGITTEHLDSVYKNAIHSDTSRAVFKDSVKQMQLQRAYGQFLQSFGSFLSKNNFKWERKTPCFNRIYISPDGTVDYFLYHFTTKNVKQEDQITEDKKAEFERLLNQFIKENKFPMVADVKFAQCSPVSYNDKTK